MAADTGGASAPHLVLLLRHALYLRNYESTVRQLADDGWKVTLATLDGSRAVDESLVSTLASEYSNVEQIRLPRARGVLQEGLEVAYTALDWLRYFDARYHDASALGERAERRVSVPVRAWLRTYGVERSTRRRMEAVAQLQHLTATTSVSRPVRRALADLDASVLAVTPLIDIGGGQHAYVTAAKSLEVPSALLVASWDNLTNKGLIHTVPDRVIVWNRLQAEEAFRLHSVPRERIETTGAQLFDWLRAPAEIPSRDEFLTSLGLDPSKRTILYAGSSSAIGSKEGGVLGDVVLPALRSHWDPEIATSNLIVRHHPTNPLTTSKIGSAFAKYGVVEDPLAGEPVIDDRTRTHYRTLLTHADAVIGVNTSALLEAAIVGTPAIPLAARKLSATQQAAPHFQMLVEAGLFQAPRSIYGALDRLSEAIANPLQTQTKLSEFVSSFIDPPSEYTSATVAVSQALAHTQLAAEQPRVRRGSALGFAVLVMLGLLFKVDRAARATRRAVIGGVGAIRNWNRQRTRTDSTAPAPAPAPAASIASGPLTEKAKLTEAERIRVTRKRHREKTVAAFKVDAYRIVWGPKRYGSLRRAIRRVRKLAMGWLRTIPGIARPTINEESSSKAARTVYEHVTRPVLAYRGTRETRSRIDPLRARIAEAEASKQPIVVGPWTSEVGFELLYWAPFVRRLLGEAGVTRSQVTIVSRGGTFGWYGLPGAKYRDIFDVVGAREFHDRIGNATLGKKQLGWTEPERGIARHFIPEGALVLHPSEMYLALKPYFAGRVPTKWLEEFLDPPAITPGQANRQWTGVQSRLPARYVAVSLYQRPSFATSTDDPGLNSILRGTREAGLPLVSLETGLVLDDHRPVDLGKIWMSRPLLGTDPAVNLDLQTRIVAGAAGLISTYGGTSYLGGLLGVPTIALYDDPSRILWHHLELARQRFAGSDVMYEVSSVDDCNPVAVIEEFGRTSRPIETSEEVA